MKYLSNFLCGVSVTLTAAVTLQFETFAAFAALTSFVLGALSYYASTKKEN